jgi:carboxyl-terminal processing protease
LRRAVTMEDGSAIILSVAKYYSPSGKAIQDVGVTPQTLMAEPEAQVELDEDGNPINPDETAPKDQGEQIKRLNDHVKKLIDTWK